VPIIVIALHCISGHPSVTGRAQDSESVSSMLFKLVIRYRGNKISPYVNERTNERGGRTARKRSCPAVHTHYKICVFFAHVKYVKIGLRYNSLTISLSDVIGRLQCLLYQ